VVSAAKLSSGELKAWTTVLVQAIVEESLHAALFCWVPATVQERRVFELM
jgi:hypothetical protein